MKKEQIELETLCEGILKEHHEDYPPEILNSTVSEFLMVLKSKNYKLYGILEDVIDEFLNIKR